jgi:integrase
MFDEQGEAAAFVRPVDVSPRSTRAGRRGSPARVRGRRLHDGTWYELRPNESGVFYIHWSEQRRSKRESTGATEIAAASAYFDEWLRLLDAPGRGQVLTCADVWRRKYGDSERHRYLWKHLAPAFGSRRPADVTQDLVDAYVSRRRAAPATIRLEVVCLAAAWNAAVKARHLAATDVPAIEPPDDSPPRDRWLTDDEITRLMAAAQERDDGANARSVGATLRTEGQASEERPPAGRVAAYRLTRVERFLWLALDACARRTAVQELRWDNGQVDFDARVIHFNPPGRAQTSKRRASVPMSDRLYAVMVRAHEERVGPYVLDTPGEVYRAVVAAAKAAGLEGVHPHVLRHTGATHMARRGVSLWIIAQLLGNSIAQVENVYAKWQPDFGRAAVETIGGRK